MGLGLAFSGLGFFFSDNMAAVFSVNYVIFMVSGSRETDFAATPLRDNFYDRRVSLTTFSSEVAGTARLGAQMTSIPGQSTQGQICLCYFVGDVKIRLLFWG